MSSIAGRYPSDWAAVRLRVLARDGGVCLMPRHHRTCKGVANSVDHIVPIARGGTHEDWNLRAAYSRCNSSDGGRMSKRSKGGLPRAKVSRWG